MQCTAEYAMMSSQGSKPRQLDLFQLVEIIIQHFFSESNLFAGLALRISVIIQQKLL